jgi:hypothetical protein
LVAWLQWSFEYDDLIMAALRNLPFDSEVDAPANKGINLKKQELNFFQAR